MTQTDKHPSALLAYYDDLTPQELVIVDEHLQHCAICRQRLLTYRTMDDKLTALAMVPPPREIRPRFIAWVDEQAIKQPPFWLSLEITRLPALLGPVSAALLLAILTVGMILSLRGQARSNNTTGAGFQITATIAPTGQTATLTSESERHGDVRTNHSPTKVADSACRNAHRRHP